MVINTLNRQDVTGDRMIREGEKPISPRASQHTHSHSYLEPAVSPGLNVSLHVKDKEWLIVTLTHHSEPGMGEGNPPLNPPCSRAFAIPLKEKSISNPENKSSSTQEAVFPSCLTKEDISCRLWPRTVMAATSLWIFYAEGIIFAVGSILGTPSFLLPSCHAPTFFLNQNPFPVDHLRTHSKSAQRSRLKPRVGAGVPCFKSQHSLLALMLW